MSGSIESKAETIRPNSCSVSGGNSLTAFMPFALL
jgi:hypothetical protein